MSVLKYSIGVAILYAHCSSISLKQNGEPNRVQYEAGNWTFHVEYMNQTN